MTRNRPVVPAWHIDPAVEAELSKHFAEMKDQASRMAQHFGSKNRPAAVGDSLPAYVGQFKARFESAHERAMLKLQPGAHRAGGRLDLDRAAEQDAAYDKRISDLKRKNDFDKLELGSFHPAVAYTRFRWALVISLLIFLGDAAFNTKSFQVTGDSLLFSFVLSCCISLAVLVFAHLAPMAYKKAVGTRQRVAVSVGSFALVTALFIGLAVFRSRYLAAHDTHVEPVYFVVINLFFFVVAALLSYVATPSWEETKRNAHLLGRYWKRASRKKEMERIASEKRRLKDEVTRTTAYRLHLLEASKRCGLLAQTMYEETVAVFKWINLATRTDGKTPDCFEALLARLDLRHVDFTNGNDNAPLP